MGELPAAELVIQGAAGVMAQAGGVVHMREASRGGSVAAEAGSRRVEAAKAALRGGTTFLVAKPVAAGQTSGEGVAPLFSSGERRKKTVDGLSCKKEKGQGVFCKHKISHYFRAQMKKCLT